MIGKPEWFGRRKYTGWGLTPKTWQGWAYIIALIIPFVIFQAIPGLDIKIRFIGTGIWLAVLFLDILHIMAKMPKDEREYKIEAISERNSSWAMVAVIAMGLFYQIFTSALANKQEYDIFLVIALGAGLVVKGLSNFILEKKAI